MVSDLGRSYAVSYCMVLLQRTVHTAVDTDLDYIQVPTQLSLSLRGRSMDEYGVLLYKKVRLCVLVQVQSRVFIWLLPPQVQSTCTCTNTVSKSVASFSAKWTSICCIAQAKQSSPDRRIVS